MRVNLCLPFLFGTKVTSRAAGALEMAVVVRGVFRLAPDQAMTPIEDVAQVGLQSDVFAEEDHDRAGALIHASDFADFKPKTDLLLRGTCYPGGERAAQVCAPKFAVGDWSKTLRVYGRRVWTERPFSPISDPVPFESMPITYENAFGGPEYARNPVGKGFKTAELPTIEDPAALITSRRDAPEPAGFGPLSPNWPQRSKKVGTEYGKSWKKTRAPFYAEDFDWSHFNSAPENQQLNGYLKGDEPLAFDFLHPKVSHFRAKLPGVRPRVFVRRVDGFTAELSMSLDTLVADLDGERLILLWRGLVAVNDDQLDDVRTLYIGSEPLAAPRPREHYLAELEALDADPAAYFKDRLIPPELKAKLAAAKESAAMAQAEAAGRAPKASPVASPVLPANPMDRMEALLAQQTDLTAEQAAAQREVLDKLKSFVQANESKLPELKEQARTAFVPTRESIDQLFDRTLAAQKVRAASLGQSTEQIEAAEKQLAQAREQRQAAEAALKARGVDHPRLSIDDSIRAGDAVPGVAMKPPSHAGPRRPPPDEPGPGANLMDRDFSGQDLSGMDLRRALLRGAKLVGTKLAGANLSGANLGKANLDGADLTGADLTRATFSDASARGAVLDGTVLSMTIFAKTDLASASLVGARGAMIGFQDTKLPAAKLRGVRLHKAAFVKAVLDEADFRDAELDICGFLEVQATGARFDDARLLKTAFIRSKMTGASFHRASGELCSWHGSTLDETDFRFARLRRSQFNRASLERARLHASDFRGGRFDRAALRDADFSNADLMSVSFCKARLAATDFSGASLYDAKFFGSTAAVKCNFEGANLTRAVWEQP